MALDEETIKIAGRDYEERVDKNGRRGIFRKDGTEPEDDILLKVLREKFREQVGRYDEY